MSNGDAAGLGRTREKELQNCCKALGFAEAPTIINDSELQDGMDQKWSPALIADYIAKYVN